eukprot:10806842-Alexandrium_andersonii.AAC.1
MRGGWDKGGGTGRDILRTRSLTIEVLACPVHRNTNPGIVPRWREPTAPDFLCTRKVAKSQQVG